MEGVMKKVAVCATCVAALLLLIIQCNQAVVRYGSGRVFDDYKDVPEREVALLLGTTPQTRIGRLTNSFFTYRIDAAEQLYRQGKVSMILVSGDEESLDGVNEVECMRDSLVARGVPSDVIILDGKGFSTYDSVVRAAEVFGYCSFTVVSQRFHNERAIFLAEHLGLDTHDVIGFNAVSPKTIMSRKTYAREYLARVKVFVDILYRKIRKTSV